MIIQEIKKELGLTNADLSKMFGYKTPASYYHAERRESIEAALVHLYQTGDDVELKRVFGWLQIERGINQFRQLAGKEIE